MSNIQNEKWAEETAERLAVAIDDGSVLYPQSGEADLFKIAPFIQSAIDRAVAAALEKVAATQAGPFHNLDISVATRELLWRFAHALGEKLAGANKKYGYDDGWRRDDWMDDCRQELVDHVEKGDPRDVAAYCAFLWHHEERTELIDPITEKPFRELLAAAQEQANHNADIGDAIARASKQVEENLRSQLAAALKK